MRRKSPAYLLILLAITALVVSACGAKGTYTAQGEAIFDTREQVGGAEGFFQRTDTAAGIEGKATSANLSWRTMEVETFIGGTGNRVIVSQEPNQKWFAYVFLPPSASEEGTMVVMLRDPDEAQAVLSWDCDITKIFLEQAGISDFTNEFCS
jgi:hypothetical protein